MMGEHGSALLAIHTNPQFAVRPKPEDLEVQFLKYPLVENPNILPHGASAQPFYLL
jgi:hypothetical protein